MNEGYNVKETRKNVVAKDNRLIQNTRYSLTNNENKAILYLISKIQPDDKPNKRYIFSCQEFQSLIKWTEDASYKKIKKMLTKLSDMSWWIEIGEGSEALIRWFNIVHMNRGKGEIEISFHEDMFPFLLNLQRHLEEEGRYYTTYKLQNITLMKHRYSPRIYEILKSYQYNNKKWTFENGTGSKYDIQMLISNTKYDRKTGQTTLSRPSSWSNWAIFKRDVLDPAVKEINKYTDIKVAYEGKKENINKSKTKAVRTIEFFMVEKTGIEQKETNNIIDAEYAEKDTGHQISIEELFFEKHNEQVEVDKVYNKEMIAKNSKYPILCEELNCSREADFSEKKIIQLYDTAIKERVAGDVPIDMWEMFATDLICDYYDKIMKSAQETKSSVYKRLLDMVENDYDNRVEKIIERYKK